MGPSNFILEHSGKFPETKKQKRDISTYLCLVASSLFSNKRPINITREATNLFPRSAASTDYNDWSSILVKFPTFARLEGSADRLAQSHTFHYSPTAADFHYTHWFSQRAILSVLSNSALARRETLLTCIQSYSISKAIGATMCMNILIGECKTGET